MKTLLKQEQVAEIARIQNIKATPYVVSVNRFGKGTEIWQADALSSWIFKFYFTQDGEQTVNRTAELYKRLKPGMEELGIEVPKPNVFQVEDFPRKHSKPSIRLPNSFKLTDTVNSCWCSLTKKLEGEKLTTVHDKLSDEEREEAYEKLGRVIAEIGKIKFPHYGYLGSALKPTIARSLNDFLSDLKGEAERIFKGYTKEQNWIKPAFSILERIIQAQQEAQPCCVINDFNKDSVLLQQGNTGLYRVSGIIDLDESLSAYPEFGLSRALAYLTSNSDPAFPDYGKEYQCLIKGYEEIVEKKC